MQILVSEGRGAIQGVPNTLRGLRLDDLSDGRLVFGPMARVWRLLGLLAIVFLPIRASGETVAADFSFVMGDNDSRSDARNLCYINANSPW